MIGYVTVGTNDLVRAGVFYDAIAAGMGVGRMYTFDNGIAWGVAGGAPGICAMRPFDGQPASVGNGMMVALEAKDPAQVDELHAIALAQGGTCEGAPGDRGNGFYGAYFRDLDGNKLAAFCFVEQG
jgi:catechol 2,3-dioxygenase-like lactoylglutathione lyase family enzyme